MHRSANKIFQNNYENPNSVLESSIFMIYKNDIKSHAYINAF